MSTPCIPDVYQYIADFLRVNTGSVLQSVIDYAVAHKTSDPDDAYPYLLSLCVAALDRYGVEPAVYTEEAYIINSLLEALDKGHVSTAGWDMPHGVWDHFKGGVYTSDRVERDADTGEPRVSYLSGSHQTWHSRRATQWNEVVKWPDGKYRSRFVYRGPQGTPEPTFKVPTP